MDPRFKEQQIRLEDLTSRLISNVVKKNEEYNESWKKRGGTGAFMMLARKWDRIENFAEQNGYDLFNAILKTQGTLDESTMDDIKDLIGYLLLVIDHMENPTLITIEPKGEQPTSGPAALFDSESETEHDDL